MSVRAGLVERSRTRLLGRPLVQLGLAGALLGLGHAAYRRHAALHPAAPPRAPIVITAERARTLEAGFVTRWGRAPLPAERSALIEQAVQDEMLYREARRLALGFHDPSVRRRLVETMRAVGDRPGRNEDDLVREAIELGMDDDPVIRRLLAEKMRVVLRRGEGDAPVGETDLQAVLERERARFLRPETVTLQQVFLDGEARGAERAARDAGLLLAQLRDARIGPDEAMARGDALPLDGNLRSITHAQLEGRFGEEFADAVFALEPGAWSGPVASPLGLHVVRVLAREPARLPTVQEVRPALLQEVRRERAEASFARGLTRLRSLYEVRVETSPAGSRARVGLANARLRLLT